MALRFSAEQSGEQVRTFGQRSMRAGGNLRVADAAETVETPRLALGFTLGLVGAPHPVRFPAVRGAEVEDGYYGWPSPSLVSLLYRPGHGPPASPAGRAVRDLAPARRRADAERMIDRRSPAVPTANPTAECGLWSHASKCTTMTSVD